jgi:hypothetical protein
MLLKRKISKRTSTRLKREGTQDIEVNDLDSLSRLGQVDGRNNSRPFFYLHFQHREKLHKERLPIRHVEHVFHT